MSYVIRQGMQMLECYGWPAFASVEADKTILESDQPITIPEDRIETVDTETGRPAYYSFGLKYPPLTFSSKENAQWVIDRFKISDARPEPWRG